MPKEPEHSLFWHYDDPALSGCITFDEDMLTAITPPPSTFTYIVDDVNKTPDSLTWLNDRVLQINYSEAALGPSVVNLNFPAPHPQLRFATGMQVGSFSSVGFEFFPTASGTYDDPLLEIDIEFPIAMDTSIVPLLSDFVIEINGSEETMDSVVWGGPTTLHFELDKGGLVVAVSEMTYATPSERLRATDLHQACPFFLPNLNIED